MEDNDIVRIKQRVLRIKGIFKIVLYLGLLFISMLFVFSIFACFSPQEKFNAVKGNNDWNVSYMFINGASFGGTVSFKIMQPLSNIMFSAKTAFITFIFTLLLMKLPVILYAAINLFNSTRFDY